MFGQGIRRNFVALLFVITKNGVSVVNICWLNELRRADTMQYSVLIKKKNEMCM